MTSEKALEKSSLLTPYFTSLLLPLFLFFSADDGEKDLKKIWKCTLLMNGRLDDG
jgi:hypothetical protein